MNAISKLLLLAGFALLPMLAQAQNPSPNPLPQRERGLNPAPPSFLGKGAGGLGSSISTEEKKPEKTAEEAKKADDKPITVPFELLKSRHMAVMVKVNGKGPYKLIFDTGAPTNLINNRLAKDAGVVKKDDKGGMLFGLGGAKTMDTLELGDIKIEKMPVMVMDHPTVTAISNALGPIDGIIGFPFFAKYKTSVDYQKKELIFTPNGYVPGDAMQGLMDKMMKGSKGKPEPNVAAPAARVGLHRGQGFR